MKNLVRSSCLLMGVLFAGGASAEINVGVISSSTGPIAIVGIPQKNTVPLLPARVAGQDIKYALLDDGSDPTASVVAAKKLIVEHKVDAIIGATGGPNTLGIIPFIAEAKVPLLAPTGSAAVVLPMDDKKKWVFKTTQNDDLIAGALIEHMAATGIKTVGFIGTADPFGENWERVFRAGAEARGIRIVAAEKFQRQDSSVAGQAIKLMAARPDAILVAAPGTLAALPQITLKDRGYAGVFYQTHGAALNEFLKLGGSKVEGTIMAASLMLVVDDVPDSHPSKKVAKDYIAAYRKLHGAAPATFGGNVFDAGLLLERAIPKALEKGQPGTVEFRSALRDALEQTRELPASQGVYNMTPADHSGFDERGRVLITVRNGEWALLK
ncbi:MAG: ABC transporter substrate-binding protein [Proteobacteria bacterium]|nr:ABC transporter substrate-binding protein [Pseudomonadota bacterium]